MPLRTSLPLPSKVRQIDGIQLLRAAAVVSVAWTHAGQQIARPRPSIDLGIFGIDLFFVISGFILSSIVLRSQQSPGIRAMWEFLKRRLLRIFPMYWFFACVALARFLHFGRPVGPSYLPAFLLLPSLTRVQSPPIVDFSWTLIFEMFFYYVMGFLLLFAVRRAVPALILLLTFDVLCALLLNIVHPVSIVAFNPILLEFVLGSLIALGHARFGHHVAVGRLLIAAGILFLLVLSAHPPPTAANSGQMILADDKVLQRVITWGFAAALIVGGIVFWKPSLDSRAGRLFVIFGNASYSAYLASPLVIEYVSRLLLRLHGAPTRATEFLLYQYALVASVMVAGWLCYNFIEWPLLRALERKFLRAHA